MVFWASASSLCFVFNIQTFLKEQVLLLQLFLPNCPGREGAADAKARTDSASEAGAGPAVAEHKPQDTAAFVTRAELRFTIQGSSTEPSY